MSQIFITNIFFFSFSTLLAALEAAGLTGVFTEPGRYTVFAPTNAAFEKVIISFDEIKF